MRAHRIPRRESTRGLGSTGAPPSAPDRSAGGYTLVELLVACGILIILGGGLASVLQQGISLWREAESTGRVYDQARLILDQLSEDLRSTVSARRGDDGSEVRMLCDRDSAGRQRLRLVRTISGEMADPILREGGRYLSVQAAAVYDGVSDASEARDGKLGAPGGRMEVLWAVDPRPEERWLWRGVRSPIGGSGSLFRNRVVEIAEVAEEAAAPSAPVAALRAVARPLTDGVLFLGLSFWGPTTNTWDPSARPMTRAPGPGQRSGPLFWWDSTRALLDQSSTQGELTFHRRAGSLGDPTDDVFPEQVEVTLVLGKDDGEIGTRLLADLASGALRATLTRPVRMPEDPRDRFLLIGDEWVALESARGTTVTIARGGRGARDTRAASHAAGARVAVGLTFRRVIDVPGRRSRWIETDSASRAGSLRARGGLRR